jgi:hypothetical protein
LILADDLGWNDLTWGGGGDAARLGDPVAAGELPPVVRGADLLEAGAEGQHPESREEDRGVE